MCVCVCAGDGRGGCDPSPQQLQMSSKYTDSGTGTLACDQGGDVPYPQGAPGYVYDPTGYLLTLPGRQVRTQKTGRMGFLHLISIISATYHIIL